MWLSAISWSRFIHRVEDTCARRQSWKLVKKSCPCDTRLHFFSQMVINRWNSLSQEGRFLIVNSFKNRCEKRRARQMNFFKDVSSTSPIRLQDWSDKVHVGLDRISPRQVQPQQVNTRWMVIPTRLRVLRGHSFVIRGSLFTENFCTCASVNEILTDLVRAVSLR